MSKNEQTFELGKHYDKSFQGLSPKDIKDNLEGLAYGKEEGSYTKNLTEAELGFAKSRFADVGLTIAKIEEDKKEAMDDFKDMLKEPNSEKKDLIEMIKHKSVRKEGILFLVDDQEKGVMYKFDENAICVDMRPLLPTEKQMRMVGGARKLSGE